MRRRNPLRVVALGEFVRARQPLGVALRGIGFRVVDRQDHRGEKRWLRACEVVGAIGVENGAVILNLVEKILDHSLRDSGVPSRDQAANDEVAVPAIHFVETATGHDIRIYEMEQAFGWKRGRIERAWRLNRSGKIFDPQMATCGELRKNSGDCGTSGKIQSRTTRRFWIGERLAAIRIASERGPGCGDEFARLRERG